MNILEKIDKYLNELDMLGYLEGNAEDKRLKQRERSKQHYEKNKEKYVQKSKEWKKANPEKQKIIQRKFQTKWRKNNPEKEKSRLSRYFDKNKETHNSFFEYGPRENSIILKKEKPDYEIAKELGRTVRAISTQRWYLLKLLSPEQIAELKK